MIQVGNVFWHKIKHVSFILGLLLLPAGPVCADNITWDGVQWASGEPGHTGAYLDSNGNIVFPFSADNNVNQPWLDGQLPSGTTWMEYSFIDPGVGVGTNYLQFYASVPVLKYNPYPLMWGVAGADILDSTNYNIIANAREYPSIDTFFGTRSAGSTHTVLVVDGNGEVNYYFDGSFFFAAPIPLSAGFGEVMLVGNNSIATDFQFGAGTPPEIGPPSAATPEPGSMVLLVSGVAALLGWRYRRRAETNPVSIAKMPIMGG